jgi:serine-protein kinase ATM
MNVLFEEGLVKYTAVADTIEAMFSSVDLDGPAILADSSLLLCSALIKQCTSDNPAAVNELSDRAVHWLFSKWKPSMLASITTILPCLT